MKIRANIFVVVICFLVLGGCQEPKNKIDREWEKFWSGVPLPLTNIISFQTQDAYYMSGTGYDTKPRQEWMKFTAQEGWSLIRDFPGKAREGAVAFVLGEKAYVGLGCHGSVEEYLTDFWVYDIKRDTWDSLRVEFPGAGRAGAVAFVKEGKAYVGCGVGEREAEGQVYFGDFYEFSPERGWRKASGLTVEGRAYAAAMEAEGSIYLCMGTRKGAPRRDVWRLGEEGLSWERLHSLTREEFPELPGRVSAFVMEVEKQEKAFVYGASRNCYVYSPKTDSWEMIAGFPGMERCFVLEGVLYGVNGISTYQCKVQGAG